MTENISQELNRPKPVVLCILDGFGIAPKSEGNAISQAQMPNMNKIMNIYPSIPVYASGDYVGLRWGEIGNSEVGHLNIGAGEIVYQSLPRLNKSIVTGEFFDNEVLISCIEKAKTNNKKLHIMGLCSSGGVHAHIDHMNAFIDLCIKHEFKNFYIHMFLDGRDMPFNSGIDFVRATEDKLKEVKAGAIASLSGRFFSMDRDNRWDRVEKTYNAIVYGESTDTATSAIDALQNFYSKNIFDEQVPPTVITKSGVPVAQVGNGDSILFFNFRADRARQLTKAFVLPSFDLFPRREYIRDLFFVSMMEYEKGLPVEVAFKPVDIANPLGKVISDAGLKQFRIAETEKYAHVTFFFNGGREEAFPGEDRVVIPSPKVSSYAQEPGMSCEQVTDRVISEISKNIYDLIVVNYANADMVGHTGDLKATVEGLEVLDWQLGKLIDTVLSVGGVILITADHGNAEQKINFQSGEISKEHTTSPVPVIIVGQEYQNMTMIPGGVNDLSFVQPVGVLADVAPTILKIMHLRQPDTMTGTPLI